MTKKNLKDCDGGGVIASLVLPVEGSTGSHSFSEYLDASQNEVALQEKKKYTKKVKIHNQKSIELADPTGNDRNSLISI